MRAIKVFTAVLAALSLTSLAALGPADDVKVRYGALSAAVAAKDATKVASFYAADATFKVETPGGQDQVTGLESILEMWQKAMTDGAMSFDAIVTDAAAKGDVVTEKGTFAMKKKDGSAFLKGTYSGVWRREKGILKLTRHHLVGK
jgi:ketosteroid isomerase-like protein